MFDFEAMRKDGYSDQEIAQALSNAGAVAELAGKGGFDYRRMKKDGLQDPEIAMGLLKQNLGQVASNAGVGKGGDIAGIAAATGSGAVKGAIASTLGLPGDLANMGGQATAALTGDSSYAQPGPIGQHGSQFFEDWLKKKGAGLHQANGPAEHYADATAAGVSSMALGKLKTLPLRAIVGALSGAGGEAGSEFMAGNPEEESGLGRVLGGLLPQAVAGYLAGRKPQVVKTLRQEIQDVGEDQLRAAADKARKAQEKLSTPVSVVQGLDDPTALSGILREVTRSSSGDVLRKVLGRQAPVGQENIDNIIASLSQKPVNQATANQIAAAGDKAITRPEQVRSRITQPYYEAAERDTVPANMPPGTVQATRAPLQGTNYTGTTSKDIQGIVDAISQRRDELHLTGTPAGDAMDKYSRVIAGMVDKHGPMGDVPVLNLDALARQARAAADKASGLNATSADAQRALGHSAVSQVLNETTTEASQNLKAGKDLYGRATTALVEPVEKSALTKMFPPNVRKTGQGDYNAFSVVLDSDKYGARDIKFAADHLRKADPEAFPAIVKQNWLQKAESAKAPVEGRTPATGIGEWATAVAGVPGSATRDKFQETIKQIALSRGKTPAESATAVQSAEDLVDSLHVISRDKGALGSINPEEARRTSGTSAVSAALRAANVMAPTQSLGKAIERAVQKRTYERIAHALSSPDGVEQLIAIGRSDQRKQLAMVLARGLMLNNAEHQSAVAE